MARVVGDGVKYFMVQDVVVLPDRQGHGIGRALLTRVLDLIAERARKIGQPTVRSLEQMVQLKRLASSDATDLSADQMLTELHDDNQSLAAYMRTTHTLTDDANDVSTTSLLEEWIDQAEERAWFLGQTVGK